MTGMNEIHTVFGAGQVGTKLAKLLASEGKAVRLVRRGAPGEAIEGVTWLPGDATDDRFADAACRGARVVYNCANPRDYTKWDGVLLPLYRAIRGAAGRAGARLVQLDNLYMIGAPSRAPFDETEPRRPCSPKGDLRARLEAELFEAHARGEVEATVGRASDYFGPETPNAAVFRPDVYERIAAGKSVLVLVDPDTPHSYSYTPDVARGLAVLGARPEAAGRVFHLPVSAQVTTRDLVARFAAHAGTTAAVRRVPSWALSAAGLFVPLAAAIAEMSYQWDAPYVVDDGLFRRTFGVEPTPLDAAIAETMRPHLARRAA